MKKLFLFILSLFSVLLSAQTEKGAAPLTPPPSEGAGGRLRAVVIGISDYQDAAIPDLRFADRDAEAFANFLRSPAGGSLDGDHLKMLTNEHATAAQFTKALDWLMEVTKEGDQVIIYFSGHGDVEQKVFNKPGYLLCWDTPPQVYMAGGTVNLLDLQDIVTTLSTQNKARSLVIADACRAGKLAGSDVRGPQLMTASLMNNFANDVKILSCQPGEYSIEGEQWGGGHGAFSYHLVNGLYGMADDNNDLIVNLQEIRRYLEDHVTSEVAPLSQSPQVFGSNAEKLATVVPEILKALRKGRQGQLPAFSPTDQRGMEEDALAMVDTTVREMYRLFKKALKDKVFLESAEGGQAAGACADAYYERLMQEPKLERLHSTMRRNYAAALQDDSQQALNAYLKADSLEMVDRYKNDPKYTRYPQYLGRAAELLGNGHYMHNSLLARQLYFEGLSLRMKSTGFGKMDSLYQLALAKQEMALELEKNAPFIVQEIGQLQQYLRHYEQSLSYYEQAMQMAPKWIIPVMDASRVFSYYLYDRPKAIEYARKALMIDSASLDARLNLARSFHHGGKADSAEIIYKQILARWSQDYKSYWYCAMFYSQTENTEACKNILAKGIELFPDKAILYFEMGRMYHFYEWKPELARKYFFKSISLDSTHSLSYWLLLQSYMHSEKPDSALAIGFKGLEKWPNHIGIVGDIGRVYENYGDYENAEKYYHRAIEINPNWSYPYFRLGAIRARFKDFAAAKFYNLKSTSLSPWWGCTGLAEIYFMENKPDSAFLFLERGSNAEPTWVEGIFHIGHVLWQHGYFEKAINQFKIILGFSPHSTIGLSNTALIYELKGDLDSAILTARIMVDNNPEYAGSYEQLSKFYRKKSMMDEAIALLKEGIGKSPGIFLHHALAETYWQKGDTAAALAEYKKVVEIGTQERSEKWMFCLANYRLGHLEPFSPCNLEEGSLDKKILVAWSEYILYGNAALYSLAGDKEESIKWLKKAFDKGYDDYYVVMIDIDLRNIHDTPEFKELMKEYFPLAPSGDQVKD